VTERFTHQRKVSTCVNMHTHQAYVQRTSVTFIRLHPTLFVTWHLGARQTVPTLTLSLQMDWSNLPWRIKTATVRRKKFKHRLLRGRLFWFIAVLWDRRPWLKPTVLAYNLYADLVGFNTSNSHRPSHVLQSKCDEQVNRLARR